ncbi:hypothetical protein [Bradyrhizobium sp. I1.14.4]|uniref:hypothetical protein n=1 Tax=unclassified Bradyrhizobium TaxID=2631580 RepID=UPI003D1ED901
MLDHPHARVMTLNKLFDRLKQKPRRHGEARLAEPELAAKSPLRPLGFGVASFSRFASEGWWVRQGSNL